MDGSFLQDYDPYFSVGDKCFTGVPTFKVNFSKLKYLSRLFQTCESLLCSGIASNSGKSKEIWKNARNANHTVIHVLIALPHLVGA